ncbi:sulfite exporter TauE/SafE family protein [Actinidia rufa]|uniref:Sulfite exporter TauE/SafE family protein n=1 Tax=Actinidia rufa TaxID=165716 RepID=A0A7J0EL73_9ERIC|nr:sulfite exporter TauE/SafE family protein [Actinidia rufa]
MDVNEVSQRAMAVGATAACVVCWGFVTVIGFGSAERLLRVTEPDYFVEKEMSYGFIVRLIHFFWQSGKSGYQHVWPELEFGRRVVVGSIMGYFGAAFGSIGGVGGGQIFAPMLTLIIGFDPKSSTAISKCMMMSAVGSAVFYNLRQRHSTLGLPVIDYDLAKLFQPMIMLGISIGVSFNVIFADWMITALLLILFSGTSTKALLKDLDTWKKETITKKEAVKQFVFEVFSKILPGWMHLAHLSLIMTKP